MSHTALLEKENLTSLLVQLCQQQRLVAPVRNSYGDTLFSVIDDPTAVEIDLINQPQNSIKSFLFPQTETLSLYRLEHNGETGRSGYQFTATLPDVAPTLYFGVRSCDMNAVLYLDKIFNPKAGVDPYYQQRRKGATFITLACQSPEANCFCDRTQTGPFMQHGFDLQLTDIGSHYHVTTAQDECPKGYDLLTKFSSSFCPANDSDDMTMHQVNAEAQAMLNLDVDVERCVTLLKDSVLPSSLLQQLAVRCQGCAGCAFVCPTCSCFTISDQKLSDQKLSDQHGERVRRWDACTFSGFTKMAGNHNPVDGESERMTKRFLHKLQHDVALYGQVSCVGCGRCVDMCFGGVDIVRFINGVCAVDDEGATTAIEGEGN